LALKTLNQLAEFPLALFAASLKGTMKQTCFMMILLVTCAAYLRSCL
jgi:hypothetical protein